MDWDTERKVRDAMRLGNSGHDAARRAGYSSWDSVQAEGRARMWINNEREEEARRKRPTEYESMPDISGAAGPLVLVMVVLGLANALPQILAFFLYATFIFAMALCTARSFQDDHRFAMLSWTIFSAFGFGSAIFYISGDTWTPSGPAIWFVELPALRTGTAFGDAMVLGVCAGTIPMVWGWLRYRTLRGIGRIAIRPAISTFRGLGGARWIMRLLGVVLSVAIVGCLVFFYMGMANPSWQLQVVLAFVAVQALFAGYAWWAMFKTPRTLVDEMAALDLEKTLFELNRKTLGRFVKSRSMKERYELERRLVKHPRWIVGTAIGQGETPGTYRSAESRVELERLANLPAEERELARSLYALWSCRRVAGEKKFLLQALRKQGIHPPRQKMR